MNLQPLQQIADVLKHLALARKLSHVLTPQWQIQKLLQFSLQLLHDSSCFATVDAQDDSAAQGSPNFQPGTSPDPKTRAGAVAQRGHLQNCPALLPVALAGGVHTQSPFAAVQALAGCQKPDWLQHTKQTQCKCVAVKLSISR